MVLHLCSCELTEPTITILDQMLPKGDCGQVFQTDRTIGQKGNGQTVSIFSGAVGFDAECGIRNIVKKRQGT